MVFQLYRNTTKIIRHYHLPSPRPTHQGDQWWLVPKKKGALDISWRFFKSIISNVLSLSIYCQSFPSSTFVVSFRFILLIFMPFCLAKLVFRGLHHFEENFLRVTGWYGSNSGDSLRKLSKLQPLFIAVSKGRGEVGGGRGMKITVKLTWSPRRLFNILMIPFHQQFIGSQLY